MPDPGAQFKPIRRRFVAWGAAAALTGSVVAVLLPWGSSSAPPKASDPTRIGPPRTLTILVAQIDDASQELVIEGQTNLVDGALLDATVKSGGGVLTAIEGIAVSGGQFAARQPSRGAVHPGTYHVQVAFSLERQPREIQEALHFQPRQLSALAPLQGTASPAGQRAGPSGFAALFEQVNKAPRDPSVLDALDRRAVELAEALWISEQKAAVHKLRLAIEVARRPDFGRAEFERLLLEAHVLAGL